jgi:hypothetical protein
VLGCVEDLSVERTAEVLGCSTATVRVPALRALRADPGLRLSATEEVVDR